MSKYACGVCAYEFDEHAEGTKWEDLPDDWICPVCGVSKNVFNKKEDAPTNPS